ncbi:response regulator transcription factor [Microbacterium sp. AZCO]|uniref:response regulator transcription factor n=1 Tax=Microbacterium sp. AZCO TaxID=3142976 RepID=UPI0031F43EFD
MIADDEVLLREGMARLLGDAGFDVLGTAGDRLSLERLTDEHDPDVAIVDIRMPPTFTDEGLIAARRIRAMHPRTGVLVLSHYVDSRYAVELLRSFPGGAGYLLKDRVSDVALLADAVRRLGAGECVVDPTIVAQLMNRPAQEPLPLSAREREVLALIAEGRSNAAIGARLFLSPKTVEAHVTHVFTKLGLEDSPDDHRRVLAALVHLRADR